MSIVISKDGKNAQKIDKENIEKEDFMQSYIHENPEAIPIYEIEEDKKLLVLIREFRTESGPIDALATDKDGDIYVVETKLYKNPDKRTVVAQALDYGASLWRHGNFGELINIINGEINEKFSVSLEEKIKDFFQINEEQVSEIFENIRSNLQQGKIKFVILMDSVADRLKDLIVYINQNSQFDIYAVQMEYYKFEQYEIIIPKLFGVEVKKNIPGSTSGNRNFKTWSSEEFLDFAEESLQKDYYIAFKKLFDFSQKNCDDLGFGTGVGIGSINPIFKKISERSFYGLRGNGKMVWKIGWGLKKSKNEVTTHLLKSLPAKLEKIGIIVNINKVTDCYEIEDWFDKVDKIIEILKELVE